MTVYRPKNSPYYHYDFQVKGQRYYGSTHCAAKRDAERYERDRRTEAATGKKDKPSISLDQAAGIFWHDKGQFDKAAKTTEYQIANLSRIIGASKTFHEIDDLAISNFMATRRGETAKNRKTLVSNSTVNREVEVLRRVSVHIRGSYQVCEIEWGKHRLKEPQERVRFAVQDEEAAMLEHALAEDIDLAELIEFAILSGARKNSVVTLLWSKVDLAAQTAEVRAKGGVWHKFPLSTRMIEILANRPKVGPFVFTYLCQRHRKERVDKLGRKHAARRKGERYPFSKQGWDRKWRRILKNAEIEDFRFHDLRHTAGTRITRASNLKVAQKLLGHTRIETTARYAHVEDDDIRRALENVEQSRNSPEVSGPGVAKTRGKAHDSAA